MQEDGFQCRKDREVAVESGQIIQYFPQTDDFGFIIWELFIMTLVREKVQVHCIQRLPYL